MRLTIDSELEQDHTWGWKPVIRIADVATSYDLKSRMLMVFWLRWQFSIQISIKKLTWKQIQQLKARFLYPESVAHVKDSSSQLVLNSSIQASAQSVPIQEKDKNPLRRA